MNENVLCHQAALFKFSASTHALSMDSYMREQRQEFYGTVSYAM